MAVGDRFGALVDVAILNVIATHVTGAEITGAPARAAVVWSEVLSRVTGTVAVRPETSASRPGSPMLRATTCSNTACSQSGRCH